MKARYVLVPLVAVVGGVTAWVALANRGSDNDLTLLETPPYPLVVIPRSELGSKPIIDWKLPIVGQIRVPSTITPTNFVDDVQVGGLICCPYPLAGNGLEELIWFHNFNQLDFGDNHKVGLPSRPHTGSSPGKKVISAYLAVPYVFGIKGRAVTLSYDPALVLHQANPPGTHPSSLRIRLPANGQEPNMKPVDVAAGTWKVRLTPHWYSPSLPLLLDVQVLGLTDNQEVWIQVERHGIFADSLKMRGSGVKTLLWKRWEDKQPVTISAFTVKPEPRELRVSIKKLTGGERRVKALWEDGSIAIDLNVTATEWSSNNENPKAYISVLVGNELVTGVSFTEQPNDIEKRWDPTGVKDGQVLKATGYRAMQMSVENVKLPYPASKAFRSWEKEEDSF